MQIAMVDPKTLEAHPQNPRVHHALGKIQKSIKEFGFTNPVLVQKGTNRIIAGHGRVQAALRGGVSQIPVLELEFSDIKAKAYMIADNKIAEESDWQKDLLSEALVELKAADFDIAALGFSHDEYLRAVKAKMADDDAPEEYPAATPRAKRGQIFKLGRHVLMCGDSTSRQDASLLLGEKKPRMVFIDPPYNVNYQGSGKNTSRTIENDNQPTAEFRDFLKKAFQTCFEFSDKNAALYCCYASRTHREFEDSLNAASWEVRSQIIWVKAVASMSWSDYRWKHEPILYCAKKNSSVDFHGDRAQVTEWKEEKSDDQLLKIIKAMVEKEEAGGSTVWRLKRDAKYDHPTQKPLQLCRIAIANSSQADEEVLDLFAGSGSTLIAAEQLDRTCFAMEIDPGFCDVIVKRYCRMFGADEEAIYAE